MTSPRPADDPPPRVRRSVRTWTILLLVWAGGLIVWTGYALALAYLLSRLL